MKTLFTLILLLVMSISLTANTLDPFATVRNKPTFKDDIYLCKDEGVKLMLKGGWEIITWNDENLLLYGKSYSKTSDGIAHVKFRMIPTFLNTALAEQGAGYVDGVVSINPRTKMIRYDEMYIFNCGYSRINFYNVTKLWERPVQGDIFEVLVNQIK